MASLYPDSIEVSAGCDAIRERKVPHPGIEVSDKRIPYVREEFETLFRKYEPQSVLRCNSSDLIWQVPVLTLGRLVLFCSAELPERRILLQYPPE
jgi:hypothetical protein